MEGQALTDAIVAKAAGLSKFRRQFLSHILLLFMSIRHRINFLQLARHSDAYCERSMRHHFERFVDFADINRQLIDQHGSGHFVLADVKTLYHNSLLLDRFISILPKGVEIDKNDPKVRELYQFGCKAA